MQCSHCNSLMAEVETHQAGRTEQKRFECQVCGRTELVTQRIAIGNRLRGADVDRVFVVNGSWVGKFG